MTKTLDELWAEAKARGHKPQITHEDGLYIVHLNNIKGKDADVGVAFQAALDGDAVKS